MGYNPNEKILSAGNVANLKLHWKAHLGAPVLTQPIYLGAVPLPSGPTNLVYVADLNGVVYALKAATGAVVWQTQTGTAAKRCVGWSVTGVIGTLTAIRAKNAVYVEAGDGNLHALDIRSGAELAGFPIQLLDDGFDLPPVTLLYGATIKWPYLYATSGGCLDDAGRHAQVVQVDLSQQPPAIINRWYVTGTPPTTIVGGSIWGMGSASIEPDASGGAAPIYVATGNAQPKSATPQTDALAVVQLSSQLGVLSANQPPLPGRDDDFGATPLPYDPPGCNPQLAVMNKHGVLFVYDRTNIGAGPTQSLQIANISDTTQTAPGSFIGNPAYDPTRLMLYLGNPADSADGTYLHGLVALSVQTDCSLKLAWNTAVGVNDGTTDNPMIPPVVANGVVYYSEGIGSQVAAFDASTGKQLWSSGTNTPKPVFAAPSVVNGQLFVATKNSMLLAFGL